MDSSASYLDAPETLPIRRGQPQGLESSGHEVPKTGSSEGPIIAVRNRGDGAPASVDPAICPRCGGKLVNPQDLGWCPKCSYCRSLETDKATAKLATQAAPAKSVANRFGEYGEMIAKLPSWGWIAAGGVCTIGALAFIANHFLPQEDSLARALISLIAVVLSIVTILCVNLWSLFYMGAADEHLGPKDIFLFFALWGKICGKLPDMRRQFWDTGLVPCVLHLRLFRGWRFGILVGSLQA